MTDPRDRRPDEAEPPKDDGQSWVPRASRRRRGLRVPVDDVPRQSFLDIEKVAPAKTPADSIEVALDTDIELEVSPAPPPPRRSQRPPPPPSAGQDTIVEALPAPAPMSAATELSELPDLWAKADSEPPPAKWEETTKVGKRRSSKPPETERAADPTLPDVPEEAPGGASPPVEPPQLSAGRGSRPPPTPRPSQPPRRASEAPPADTPRGLFVGNTDSSEVRVDGDFEDTRLVEVEQLPSPRRSAATMPVRPSTPPPRAGAESDLAGLPRVLGEEVAPPTAPSAPAPDARRLDTTDSSDVPTPELSVGSAASDAAPGADARTGHEAADEDDIEGPALSAEPVTIEVGDGEEDLASASPPGSGVGETASTAASLASATAGVASPAALVGVLPEAPRASPPAVVAIAPVVVVQRAIAVVGAPSAPPSVTKSLTTPGGFAAPTPTPESRGFPDDTETHVEIEAEPETETDALPLSQQRAVAGPAAEELAPVESAQTDAGRTDGAGPETVSAEPRGPEPPSVETGGKAQAAGPAEETAERLSDPALELEPTSAATELSEDEADILVEEAASPPVPVKAPPPPVVSKPPAPPPPKAPPAPAPPSAPAPTGPAAIEERAAMHSRPPKKKPQWWEELFNDDYLRTVPVPSRRDIERQCDFIEQRLGLAHGATILDVGCGLGLHAIELTRRGFVVVGLDLSLPMLSRAADEAQDQGFKINFLHADMREMNFEGAFDAVLLWGTTLGYFDDDTNRQVLERIYRALKPGGLLLIETVNRDYAVRTQPNLVWFQGDGCVVMEETSFNFIASRLAVKRNVILDDGRQKETHYSIRLYALHELGLVLHKGGFRVVEVSGRESTPGIYFGADSPKLIILAERRVQAPQPQIPPAPPKKSGEDNPKTGEPPTSGEG